MHIEGVILFQSSYLPYTHIPMKRIVREQLEMKWREKKSYFNVIDALCELPTRYVDCFLWKFAHFIASNAKTLLLSCQFRRHFYKQNFLFCCHQFDPTSEMEGKKRAKLQQKPVQVITR